MPPIPLYDWLDLIYEYVEWETNAEGVFLVGWLVGWWVGQFRYPIPVRGWAPTHMERDRGATTKHPMVRRIAMGVLRRALG